MRRRPTVTISLYMSRATMQRTGMNRVGKCVTRPFEKHYDRNFSRKRKQHDLKAPRAALRPSDRPRVSEKRSMQIKLF